MFTLPLKGHANWDTNANSKTTCRLVCKFVVSRINGHNTLKYDVTCYIVYYIPDGFERNDVWDDLCTRINIIGGMY